MGNTDDISAKLLDTVVFVAFTGSESTEYRVPMPLSTIMVSVA